MASTWPIPRSGGRCKRCIASSGSRSASIADPRRLAAPAVDRDTILAAKAGCGGEDCILTAGILPADCVPSANPTIWQFLDAFGNAPSWGAVDDFTGHGKVVSDALADGIVDTCEQIDPAG
jgi:hypothetical protein